ncbi:MAG: response regulator transcription factor [Anaerolineae bacterium]|nr:response regulator transcription factor [Anaerolineae bacterium]
MNVVKDVAGRNVSAEQAPRILIVEDNPDMCTILVDNLQHEGYVPLVAQRGDSALALIDAEHLDLAILDIRLPGGPSGLEVLAYLKTVQPEAEVVMLTALDEATPAVTAIKQGASDYLIKPFRRHTLLAAVERARQARQGREQVRIGDRVVDLRTGCIQRCGQVPAEQVSAGQSSAEQVFEEQVPVLSLTEIAVLRCLVRAGEPGISYVVLWQEVWSADSAPDRGLIQRTLSNLRQKIGKEWIEVIRGRGYRLRRERERGEW